MSKGADEHAGPTSPYSTYRLKRVSTTSRPRRGAERLELISASVDWNLRRRGLRLRRLRHLDLQHTIRECGLDLVRRHVKGDGNAAIEAAEVALHAVIRILFHFLLSLALAADHQVAAVDFDVDILL